MASITMNIEERDLTDLVKKFVEQKGFLIAPDFRVGFNVSRGDRPYDIDTVSLLVSGIKVP